MAWAGNSGIADNLFSGATVSAGALTIPSGTITSYTPTSISSPSASEFVFGMCETMSKKVSDAQLTNVTSTSSSSLSGSTLTKVYTFTVRLDFNEANNIGNLNVKDAT